MNHVQVEYHFIRDVIDSKRIELVKAHADDNAADLLSKSLLAAQFRWEQFQSILPLGRRLLGTKIHRTLQHTLSTLEA